MFQQLHVGLTHPSGGVGYLVLVITSFLLLSIFDFKTGLWLKYQIKWLCSLIHQTAIVGELSYPVPLGMSE